MKYLKKNRSDNEDEAGGVRGEGGVEKTKCRKKRGKEREKNKKRGKIEQR